jgi:hypothetical protein
MIVMDFWECGVGAYCGGGSVRKKGRGEEAQAMEERRRKEAEAASSCFSFTQDKRNTRWGLWIRDTLRFWGFEGISRVYPGQ